MKKNYSINKFIFLFCLILNSSGIFAQPCNTSNTIPINTGYDFATSSVVAVGANDPQWTIDNANNIPGAINNSPAVVCIPNGGAASSPNSQWIGFANPSQYVTNNNTLGYYLITFRYKFRTCEDDSLFFSLNLSNDNYISDLRIDGVSTGFSQPVSLASINWTSFAAFFFSDFYTSATTPLK